ncbi:MAG TPA: cytochrome c-type biogenesis protein CcmH [Acidobacteriota bacterium]|nr:cytochrome c-type biogenesis protein CcmH [Acidobacteriota bacterium]
MTNRSVQGTEAPVPVGFTSRVCVILLALLLLFSFAVLAQPGTVQPGNETLDRAKTDLMCICGCPHQLGQCGDECGVAPQLISDIQKMLDEGAGQQEIYGEFEARYGSMVYAAPKAEGFNLIGWILPFVGLMFGGLLVWGVVRKLRVDNAGDLSAASHEPVSEIDEKYRRMLQEELSE